MLTANDFRKFQESFETYLMSGKLPGQFKSAMELMLYMDNHLSCEQSQILKLKYNQNLQEPNDFTFLWNCLKTVPRAFVESIVVGIVSGLANSQVKESPISIQSAGVGGGICWLFTRLSLNANKIRVQNQLYQDRYGIFNKVLNKSDKFNLVRSPGITFEK